MKKSRRYKVVPQEAEYRRNSRLAPGTTSQDKGGVRNLFFVFLACALCLVNCSLFAQGDDTEYVLDTNSNTVALPQIFLPNIDLSGRGFNNDVSWPQSLAAGEVLDSWHKTIGFRGMYRLQYNLWEISQLANDRDRQNKLLDNYDAIIKKISDAGGIVILNIFSTPQGLGKVLDRKSAPVSPEFFKELIKNYIRELSCKKRYNIWYEVWSAPDLDNFFLGRQQEYLNLYRAVAESAKELEAETKVHIPVGGPSVSGWFRNCENNTIITPERSLIYELIKFCYHYELPLNFISWHAYSTDPKAEKEMTAYNKTSVALIRDWLSYFSFERDTPLIVDEWNYDSGANVLTERKEKSHIGASYILSRIKNMWEAGVNYQVFFSLEDFQGNKEGVVRNVGVFWFTQDPAGYKGAAKATYNALRMLGALGKNLIPAQAKLNDEFVGVLSARGQDDYAVLIYNYIDPDIFRNYLSRNIALLSEGERRALLAIFKSDRLEKIMRKELDVSVLRTTKKVKNLLKKAQELNDSAEKFKGSCRNMNLEIKNLKDSYLYQRYVVDEACGLSCDFVPREEKVIAAADSYQETIALSPYSLSLIILQKKPKEVEIPGKPEQTTEAQKSEASEKAQEAEKPQEKRELQEPAGAKGIEKSQETQKSVQPEKPQEVQKPTEGASAVNLPAVKQTENLTKEMANVTEAASAEKVKGVAGSGVQGEK